MKPNLYLLLVMLAGWYACVTLSAQELSIPAIKDNTLYSEGDSSNGKGHYLFTGITANGYERRSLLKFDLSQIEPTDSIISASLTLYVSRTTSGVLTVKLHKLKNDWGEGTSHAKFEEGGGATAKSGDATWNYAFFDTVHWTNAGGDHRAVPSASAVIGAIGSYSWAGDTVISDIREWIQKPDSNFGWTLIVEGTDLHATKRFNSREDTIFQPQLVVNISNPSSAIQRKESVFEVFPNPSNGIVHIRGNQSDPSRVRLFDMMGNEIKGRLEVRRISPFEIICTVRKKGTFVLEFNHSVRKKIIII